MSAIDHFMRTREDVMVSLGAMHRPCGAGHSVRPVSRQIRWLGAQPNVRILVVQVGSGCDARRRTELEGEQDVDGRVILGVASH
jgi:hypothetical protein